MSSVEHSAAQAILTIDLEALKANWRDLAERSAPAECSAVVKADAYGLGIQRAVTALARAGCRTFFVAHLEEGIRARTSLRDAGFADQDTRVFLLHGLQPGAEVHPALFAFRLGPVLASVSEMEAWAAATSDSDAEPDPAIQIDTGMNRIGLAPSEVTALSQNLVAATGANLLISHLVAAEEPDNPSNEAQIVKFEQARRTTFPNLSASLSNSSGIFLSQKPHYDLVRPGYALYGGNPCPGRPNPMRPVVALHAALLQLREIEAGESVGYNGRWIAQRPTQLATIGVGYADGLPRNARTVGMGLGPHALLGGVPCPLVGRVSMDLSILDVTDAPADLLRPGALVEFLGSGTTVDDLGTQTGTIGYEILTNLGRRYHRAYLENAT